MTARRPCPPAPGPLEEYAARFDDLFFSLAQRRGFREYLTGLLAPGERNKTITCLAGAEPVAGAGMPGVQRLQFFLSESPWEAELVNDRRLELLREESATVPHDGGVIVIDDSGDRKDYPRGSAQAQSRLVGCACWTLHGRRRVGHPAHHVRRDAACKGWSTTRCIRRSQSAGQLCGA
ncbi:transposase [Streptomyces mirabilis]|uniref:transposase n=1 Tax=Streptomyces mirabilis TaxID=68239 RepID=UPI0036C01D79